MTTAPWPIDFVYFDLDDTLLDHAHAEHQALVDLHAESDSPLGAHTFDDVHRAYRAINPVIWKQYSAGELTKIQAKVGRFTRLLDALEVDWPGGDEWLADAYLDRYSFHWQAIDGAFEAYDRIAASMRVGLMTNGFSEIQRAKLAQFPGLAEVADAIIISEEVGVLKPDPRLFEAAASEVDVRPERILYVGDSLHSDVGGGIGAGWKVAWYSETDHEHADVMSFTDWNRLTGFLGL